MAASVPTWQATSKGRPNCSASQPKKALRENQVGGARHGQELGESLDHAEQRRVEEQHGAGSRWLYDTRTLRPPLAGPLDGFLDGHGRAAGRGLAAAEDDGDRRRDEHVEYVPLMMPTIIAKANPRSTSPPNRYSATTDRNVTPDVMTVRPSVWLTLRFTTLSSGSRRSSRAFSRTRSKMTMVSFTE